MKFKKKGKIMEDEIGIGEYIRTKEGIIDKVIIEYNGKCNNPDCNEKHISCKYNYYDEKDIVKHSKNIIDLIECGDYVNGYCIDKIINDTLCMELIDMLGRLHLIPIIQNEEDIKTIVTEEQFLQIEYEVGE